VRSDGGDKCRDQPFHHREDIFPRHERHLQVELGEFGLPVSPQILVTHASRDLEVLFIPGDHEQLFELLRALRQGKELARLDPARNHVIRAPSGVDLIITGVSISMNPCASM